MNINKNSIAKTALKLNAFKNLVAITLTTTTYMIPALIFFATVNIPVTPLLLITVPITSAVISLLISVLTEKVNKFSIYQPSYWNNLLNRPLISLIRGQNEKIILTSRRLLEQSSFTPQQYDWLARHLLLSVSTPQYREFEEVLKKQSSLENDRTLGVNLKDRAMINSLHELESLMKSIDSPALEAHKDSLAAKKSYSLNLDSLLKVKELPTNKYDTNALYYEISEEQRTIIENKYFKGLTPTDYKDFKQIIKTEQDTLISITIDLLGSLSHPLIDWEQIKEIIKSNYKKSNNDYKSWITCIDEYIKTQTEQKKSATITQQMSTLSGIDSHTASVKADKIEQLKSATPQFEPKNLQDLTSPQLDESKWCDFVEYSSSIYHDKWLEIKTLYTNIFKMQSSLDKVDLIELNSHLKTVLPIVISIDMTIKNSNITYPQETKLLAGKNLDMIISKLHDLNVKMESNLSRGLEVATRYQENKIMKMGKN